MHGRNIIKLSLNRKERQKKTMDISEALVSAVRTGAKVVLGYHDECFDGYCSAAIIIKFLEKYGIWPEVHPIKNSNRSLLKSNLDLKDKVVILVDICVSKEELVTLVGIIRVGFILDHHVSAQKDLEGFRSSKFHILMDTTRCGATIAHDVCFPGQGVPYVVKLVRGKDLWEDTDPNWMLEWKAFTAAVDQANASISLFSYYLLSSREHLEEIIALGKGILVERAKVTDELCKESKRMRMGIHTVHVLKLSKEHDKLINDCGNTLAKRPDCDFAVVYMYNPDQKKWSISFRGIKEKGVNLSEIAKQYGGGGHPLASGASRDNEPTDLFTTV